MSRRFFREKQRKQQWLPKDLKSCWNPANPHLVIYQVIYLPRHTIIGSCFDHNPLLSLPVAASGQPPTRQVILPPNLDMDSPSCTSINCVSSYSLQVNEKTLRKWLDNELEVVAKVHQVRFQYEKQIQVYVFKTLFSVMPLAANFFLPETFLINNLLWLLHIDELHWLKS